jgi:hypothetical protein
MAEKRPLMTGLFHDRDSAERAYGTLSSRGYRSDDVSLLMSDETRNRSFPRNDPAATEMSTKAVQGAGVGAGRRRHRRSHRGDHRRPCGRRYPRRARPGV